MNRVRICGKNRIFAIDLKDLIAAGTSAAGFNSPVPQLSASAGRAAALTRRRQRSGQRR